MLEFHFERTPIMSTYLVAYIVGEVKKTYILLLLFCELQFLLSTTHFKFDFAEKQDENGVLIRIYTPIGKSEMAQFSLDVTLFFGPFFLAHKEKSKTYY